MKRTAVTHVHSGDSSLRNPYRHPMASKRSAATALPRKTVRSRFWENSQYLFSLSKRTSTEVEIESSLLEIEGNSPTLCILMLCVSASGWLRPRSQSVGHDKTLPQK